MNPILDYIKYLPVELILFCIIPYTYQPQCPELLHDIRTYKKDTGMLDNTYGTTYTESILLYDLKRFCQVPNARGYADWLETIDVYNLNILPRCFAIWKRHFMHKDMSNSQLHTLIINFDIMHTSIQRRIMFLWGLLLPNERTQFINTYILEV